MELIFIQKLFTGLIFEESFVRGAYILGSFIFSEGILRPHKVNPMMKRVSLGNRNEDAIVLILAANWSEGLWNFQNTPETSFEPSPRTSNDARFCQTEV